MFPSQICSIARTLEIVGEWWTLLIVREAFFGTEQFSDFQSRLGIAKNVLSVRLNKLVKAGVLTRQPMVGRGNPVAYRLTDQGRDLLPALIALMQWGDRWINPGRAPVRVVTRDGSKEIARLSVVSRDGKQVSAHDLKIVSGPGADEAVVRRFGRVR
jgi:DNA-binding HxlR family transcriptional regulator